MSILRKMIFFKILILLSIFTQLPGLAQEKLRCDGIYRHELVVPGVVIPMYNDIRFFTDSTVIGGEGVSWEKPLSVTSSLKKGMEDKLGGVHLGNYVVRGAMIKFSLGPVNYAGTIQKEQLKLRKTFTDKNKTTDTKIFRFVYTDSLQYAKKLEIEKRRERYRESAREREKQNVILLLQSFFMIVISFLLFLATRRNSAAMRTKYGSTPAASSESTAWKCSCGKTNDETITLCDCGTTKFRAMQETSKKKRDKTASWKRNLPERILHVLFSPLVWAGAIYVLVKVDYLDSDIDGGFVMMALFIIGALTIGKLFRLGYGLLIPPVLFILLFWARFTGFGNAKERFAVIILSLLGYYGGLLLAQFSTKIFRKRG